MASPFSGRAGRKASIDAEKYLGIFRGEQNAIADQSVNTANANTKRARTDLNTNYGRAITDLGQYYDTSRQDLKRGSAKAEAGLTEGYNTAGQRYDTAYSDLDRAYSEYDQLASDTSKGSSMYVNALGVNGEEGNQAAVDAFHTGPGYEWQVSQAADEVLRQAGATGLLASGNTLASVGERVRGAADQEYGTWLDRLAGQQKLYADVTGARAGIRGDQANVNVNRAASDQTYGQNLSDLRYKSGADLSALATNQGENVANARVNLGTALANNANTNTGYLNDINKTRAAALLDLGSQQTAAHTSGMMAGQQAAQNRMNAIMGGVETVANLAGKIFGKK